MSARKKLALWAPGFDLTTFSYSSESLSLSLISPTNLLLSSLTKGRTITIKNLTPLSSRVVSHSYINPHVGVQKGYENSNEADDALN